MDFSKATFKEQPPAPHGLILTMNIADSCECHVNLEAVCQIQFAQRQTSYLMHVIRLINKGGQTGLTLVLHTCNKKDYEEPESGNPEAWEALKAKYGGLDVIQVQS